MSVSVCLSVCLSVSMHISGITRPNVTNSSCVHVTNTYGSVLLSQHHDKLRTSGFVNDVVFARNDRKWAIRKWRILKRLTWRISEPGAKSDVYDCLVFAVNGTKVCRYYWHSAGSLGRPFPLLKYKYIFQVKSTEAILSNSTRKQLWFDITKMLTAFKKINLLCHLL